MIEISREEISKRVKKGPFIGILQPRKVETGNDSRDYSLTMRASKKPTPKVNRVEKRNFLVAGEEV